MPLRVEGIQHEINELSNTGLFPAIHLSDKTRPDPLLDLEYMRKKEEE